MSALSRLTLVIPTYNRHDYALRSMKFWSGKGLTLIVMDGSAFPFEPRLLLDLGTNIQYYHLPASIHDRFKQAIDLIRTEYAAFQGDDEFFSPTGIEKCIEELDANKELVSCMGRCVAFNYSGNEITGRLAYNELRDYKLMQDDPIERMITHMGNYTSSTIYAITRAGTWKKAMSVFVKDPFTVFSMDEYQFEMINAFMGKSKVIPYLFWFRSHENERIVQAANSINKFNVWWKNSEYKEEREKFISIMTESLLADSSISKKKARRAVIKTSDAFTKWSDAQGIGDVVPEKTLKSRIIQFVGSKTPLRIKKLLQKPVILIKSAPKAIQTVPVDKKMYPFKQVINELLQEGIKVNGEEILEIENIVATFHKQKMNS